MKKLSYCALALILIFYSCGEDAQPNTQSKLNLIAPNGEQIAASVEQLYKKASDVVFDKFATRSFTISGIDYLNVKEGYAAQVNYVANGEANFFYLLKTPQYNSPAGRTAVAGCTEWSVSCSGGTCCTPNFNLNTGNASCTCSSGGNSSCVLGVKCTAQQ